MATENVFLAISGEFSEAVATQYLVAKNATTANEYGISKDKAADSIVGVFQNTGPDGGACSIAVLGITKIKTGGAIAKGARVAPHTDGTGITTTTKNNRVVGIAMETGGTDDIIPLLLTPGNTYHVGVS